MATASATPFSAEAQQQVAQQASPEKSKMDLANGKSFKLVASPSGKDLYVEAKEYDPLAPHRPRDRAHNKGEGMGFMFGCFSCCMTPSVVERSQEPAHTAERYYSLPPSASAKNLGAKTE